MKRWTSYAKPYLPYFIIGPICMIIEVVGEVLMPKMLGALIDYLTYATAEGEELSPFIARLAGIFGENTAFVVAMTAGMVLTALLMMIGGVGGAYFGAKAAVNYAADLRSDIFKKVQEFSFSNIDRFSTGSLVTRLTNDVTQIQNFVNMLLRMALRAPGMFIGALIMAFATNRELSVVFLVSLPLLIIALYAIIRRGFPRFSAMQSKIDTLNSDIQENITNVRVVKSFVRQEHEKQKFAAANGELKKSGLSAMLVMILMSPVMSFFMYATTLAVLWFGGNKVIGGTLTPGELTTFITYATQILMSLMMVSFLFVMLSRAMASGRRISEVLDEKVDITDPAPDARGKTPVTKGSVEFRNVSFRYYKGSDEKVLDNISLSIPAGKTVGIIGSTGCGKTTLVSLIPRLYDTDSGEVLVDGRNVRDYSLYDLREGVGMVLQQNVLFSGTVAENLRWGNEAATDEELRSAAGAAQADSFVSAFSDDHLIDRGGANVSGGQKQRLCIARALLKRPRILILDDSTSAVDTATEKRIREAFGDYLEGATKIIIAQRISSVQEADMIAVMNEGRITGVGTHEELLASNTEYREIYYSQNERKEA